jgi:hypothetical protein
MTAPECPYCGTTVGLRMSCDGGGYIAPEYTCETCFMGTDDGPCFDDLQPLEADRPSWLGNMPVKPNDTFQAVIPDDDLPF